MIGIIVLTYNTWDCTLECLQSIASLRLENQYRIYLVDNASEIEMPEECRDYVSSDKRIIFLQALQNRGYAAGNNIGLDRAEKDGCDAILIANNDVVFTDRAIDVMYGFLKGHPKVGMVGPKIILPNGKIQETNLGCKMTLTGKYLYILRKTPLRSLSKKFVNSFRVDLEGKSKPIRMFGVSGCCFMLSCNCLNEIGKLDENTFLYEEENILGCRLEARNMEVMLLPSVQVVHKHGQSTKSVKAFAYTCLVESEIYYCRKYLNAKRWQIAGLYLIRVLGYLEGCLNSEDYRKNVVAFWEKTMKRISERPL